MEIGALERAMGMIDGQNSLDRGARGAEQRQRGDNQELLRKLMAMLSGSGSGQDSCGEVDPELCRKMMAGRQGMEALMPDSDNGRKIGA